MIFAFVWPFRRGGREKNRAFCRLLDLDGLENGQSVLYYQQNEEA